MVKQKTKNIFRSCVRTLAKWGLARRQVTSLVAYAAAFGFGWVGCFVATKTTSDTTLFMLAGVMVGAIAPMIWLTVGVLLAEIDKERRTIDAEHLAAMEARWIELEKRSRLGALNAMEWKLPDDDS